MSADDLIDFVESVSGDAHLAVEERLGDGFVRLKTAEAERRQAKHDIRCVEDVGIEMLRNARDAHATSIFLATSREGRMKTLTFLDDGDGIPIEMHERVFEPRVTSKLETMVMDKWGVHGRGMALYSIKANTLEARVIASGSQLGSSLGVRIDLDALPEKTDQSSLPVIGRDEEGSTAIVSGPHNVNRTVAEFALDLRDEVDVFLGSPAEIVATLVDWGRPRLAEMRLLFCDDIETMPLTLRPAAAADATELVELSARLGLDVWNVRHIVSSLGKLPRWSPSSTSFSNMGGMRGQPSAKSTCIETGVVSGFPKTISAPSRGPSRTPLRLWRTATTSILPRSL